MGIAGTGLGVILPAMARMVQPEKRALALGVGTAAGSAGQFLFIPVAREFLSGLWMANSTNNNGNRGALDDSFFTRI